jgi:hypothetical protein
MAAECGGGLAACFAAADQEQMIQLQVVQLLYVGLLRLPHCTYSYNHTCIQYKQCHVMQFLIYVHTVLKT